jgi:hypothetical protein
VGQTDTRKHIELLRQKKLELPAYEYRQFSGRKYHRKSSSFKITHHVVNHGPPSVHRRRYPWLLVHAHTHTHTQSHLFTGQIENRERSNTVVFATEKERRKKGQSKHKIQHAKVQDSILKAKRERQSNQSSSDQNIKECYLR